MLKSYVLNISLLLVCFVGWSQNRKQTNDTIDTQVVNVVKAYTPTISDAFKIKEVPNLKDDVNNQKKDVKYNIFSIPVASTFTPAKGKAAKVDKAKPEVIYDNYASLGFGSYTSILGELYLNQSISRSQTIGGYLSHHSSQGGIDEVLVDDDFSKTYLNVNYKQQLRDLSFKIDSDFGYNTYNWYGLPQPIFDEAAVEGLNVGHSYFNFDLGGEINFEDALFKNVNVDFRYFGDDFSSSESHFYANTEFDIPVQDQQIATEVYIDFLSGGFDSDFFNVGPVDYGNFTLGLAPSYKLLQDDLTLNLGAEFVYLNDTELSKSKFYIYPKITASYRLVDELLIAFGGVEGGLQQNTYFNFAKENPFVSPSLLIAPTDQAYDAYLGLKGKLSNSVSYNINGKYTAENNKALYKSNPLLNGGLEPYHNGNSYQLVYDDVTTIAVSGALNVDVNRNFTLGIKGSYFNYSTDNQEEAWNLPDFEGSVFMDYQISESWFAGASLYYAGDRKDEFLEEGVLVLPVPVIVDLDSYFDVNLHVGYHINDRFSAYVKGNNITNQDYQKWVNYQVQGIQFLAGATYKFDF